EALGNYEWFFEHEAFEDSCRSGLYYGDICHVEQFIHEIDKAVDPEDAVVRPGPRFVYSFAAGRQGLVLAADHCNVDIDFGLGQGTEVLLAARKSLAAAGNYNEAAGC